MTVLKISRIGTEGKKIVKAKDSFPFRIYKKSFSAGSIYLDFVLDEPTY